MPRPNRLQYRRDVRDLIAQMKAKLGCHVKGCNEHRAPALEWHHRDPATKHITISDAISQDWSQERVLGELAKCVVICKNCHACHHSVYDRRGKRRA